jgi:hypothetical protein
MMTLLLVKDFVHDACRPGGLSPFERLTYVESIFKIMSKNVVVTSLILSQKNSSFMLF